MLRVLANPCLILVKMARKTIGNLGGKRERKACPAQK
jgi:hypothetical protein